MTARQLAEKMGVTPQYISNIANGKQNMSLPALQEMGNLIGVPAWRFLVSPEEVAASRVHAYIHINGTDHLPSSVEDTMTLLKEWDSEAFYHLCRVHCFSNLRELHATNAVIVQALDAICKELKLDCDDSE